MKEVGNYFLEYPGRLPGRGDWIFDSNLSGAGLQVRTPRAPAASCGTPSLRAPAGTSSQDAHSPTQF